MDRRLRRGHGGLRLGARAETAAATSMMAANGTLQSQAEARELAASHWHAVVVRVTGRPAPRAAGPPAAGRAIMMGPGGMSESRVELLDCGVQ